MQLFLKKQQQHIDIVLKKSSNVFVSNACLKTIFPKSLNHQIVWLRRKYFALLIMKSLKFIISSLYANGNLFEMACRQQKLKVYTRYFIQILKLSERNRQNSLAKLCYLHFWVVLHCVFRNTNLHPLKLFRSCSRFVHKSSYKYWALNRSSWICMIWVIVSFHRQNHASNICDE